MDRLKTHNAHGVNRLTTTTIEEPQEAEQQEIVEQEVTVTDANIVPKIEPVSGDKKKKEEEEDEDILFCSYMALGTYAGKRTADIQAVTITNIKEEKINQDYYKYATDNLSQQMEKVRLV